MACHDDTSDRFQRLPNGVSPAHYDVRIVPDLEKCTFNGTCNIRVVINEPTNQFTLNAADLVIRSANYVTNSKETHPLLVTIIAKSEILILKSLVVLNKESEGTIILTFDGTMNDRMKGFYRSKYFSTTKQKDQFAGVCHFEPTSARRAFPCWDEPIFKATFSVSLVVPEGLVALSNMPIIKTQVIAENLKEVSFNITPVMSTYLVAFVVGEFEFVEGTVNQGSGSNVKVRIYTPSGKSDQGNFSLNFAMKALPFYNEYFDIKCNLPKMDLIAIPDFAISAMENWGLITFREQRLLVDEDHTSPATKQIIALVVAHEISHFWFGNLVTMNWWTHLWLKEGFASFIMYLATDAIHPDYLVWELFVATELAEALALDALHSSHPIEVAVDNPDQIGEIFDDISYSKGASVIRMLHKYLGDESFRKGLHLYLKRHSFANASTEELWAALTEVCSKPVGPVMSTWTLQKGYPVVTVSEKQETGSGTRVLVLTQEKFSADNRIPDAEKSTRWMIPITVVKSSNPSQICMEVLFSDETTEIELSDIESHEWVKLNSETVGVYRVQYSQEMLDKLVDAVGNNSLLSLDRLGLMSDLFAFVSSGRVATSQVMKMMASFQDELNYTVWTTIDSCLEKLSIILSETDLIDSFHSFGRSLLQKVYRHVGWEKKDDERHVDTLLRGLVINRLALFHDQVVIEKARELFKAHLEGKCTIPSDLRSAVYQAVTSSTRDETDLNNILTLYRESDLNEEKVRLSRSLGLFSNSNLIDKVIEFSMSNAVRNQDTVFVLSSISSGSKIGREKVWNYFKSNVKEFTDRYEGSHIMWKLVKVSLISFELVINLLSRCRV